jgi:hypothetical protein
MDFVVTSVEKCSVLLWLERLKKAGIELLAFNFVQVLQDLKALLLFIDNLYIDFLGYLFTFGPVY